MPKRMTAVLAAFVAAAVASAASTAFAQDLKVGDPAPELAVGKWVKGEPVKGIESDKTYVIECWATWCGPCIRAIPHVTELQAKHKEVVFIGANVWEQDESKVEPFVQKMGDKMNYRVVMDDKSKDKEGAIATNWLRAAGQDGIPCSFIVDDGKIAWIGHPMQMEKVLDQVVAGTFDAKKAQADKDSEKADGEKIQADFNQKVVPLIQKRDYAGAAAALGDMAKAYPSVKSQLLMTKFGVLAQGNLYDEAYKTADEIVAENNNDAELLNALAWTIVDEKSIQQRDLDRAQKYAERAVEISESKNGAILDTLARIHADKGDYTKAVELQTKAVEVSEPELKAELQKSLDEYKSKAK